MYLAPFTTRYLDRSLSTEAMIYRNMRDEQTTVIAEKKKIQISDSTRKVVNSARKQKEWRLLSLFGRN